jgi:HD superfamily phosphohydrolase
MQNDPIVCEIRCPVHGFIGLTDFERRIVDSPQFQRLRRIKQLAWTDYVYPGATHSRFEHSLGVMHLATRLFDAIVGTSDPLLRKVFKYNDNGLARERQTVRLAALLHDVGHPPFSHATEKLLPMKAIGHYSLFPGEDKEPQQYEHEDYSVAIIEGPLSEVIVGHPSNKRNFRIEPSEVSGLIQGTTAGSALFWKDIISGQLDADRMDYLLRDSLHAGVSYGKYDLNRIISSVCAIERPSEESQEPKVAVMKGGAYSVEALIVARYWMHKQVYLHKTRLACNRHLCEAMREILKGETGIDAYPAPNDPAQLQAFLDWDDFRVMGQLAGGAGGEHGKRLMTRNHYRLVCEIEALDTSVNELDRSKKRADAIIKALGSKVTDVQRPKPLWYKTEANDELILVDDESRRQIGYLSSYSALMKSINIGSQVFVYADKLDAAVAKSDYEGFLRDEAEQIRSAEKAKREASTGPNLVPQDAADAIVPSAQLSFPPQGTGKAVQREIPINKGVPNVG